MSEKINANNEVFETGFHLGLSGKTDEFDTYLEGYNTRVTTLTTQRDTSADKAKTFITDTCQAFKELILEIDGYTKEFERKRISFIKEVQTEWGLFKNLDGINSDYIQKVRTKSMGMLEKYEHAIDLTIERLNKELQELRVQDVANNLKHEIIQNYDDELIKLEEDKEHLKSGYYKGLSLRGQIEEIDEQQSTASSDEGGDSTDDDEQGTPSGD